MLQDEVQQMLRTTQKEIGFKYIKFHGLFDDRLSVYSNNGKREIFNFTELDRIFDFLLSINLRPLIQLSFMPKDMALTPQREVFFNHPLVISRPKSISKWTELVSKFTLHMINRYGIKEVEKWPFTLWNEPESNKDMFGLLDDEYFASFFSATFDAVKAIDKDISFGFPSITTSTLTETNFLFEFMNLISPRIPDFVLLNFYPMTGLNCFLDDAIESNTLTLDYDKDAMSKCIDKLLEKQKQIQAKVGISLPMYITEWNSTTSHRSTANDLAYKGAYVVRNIISNYDRIGSFGYWSLTDYINEVPEREELFHGGHGLFTRNGIKKPPYYAFLFLSKLYENLIYKNDYLIITKDEANNISSVMCNFINISKLYADGKLSGLNNSSRYSSFESEVTRSQIIKIDSVENGDYVLEEYYVNKYHGSIFDLWLKMFNGNEPANQEEMDMLKTSCTPGFKMHKITILDNAFSYNVILEAHEIRLFKLKRIYKKEEEE